MPPISLVEVEKVFAAYYTVHAQLAHAEVVRQHLAERLGTKTDDWEAVLDAVALLQKVFSEVDAVTWQPHEGGLLNSEYAVMGQLMLRIGGEGSAWYFTIRHAGHLLRAGNRTTNVLVKEAAIQCARALVGARPAATPSPTPTPVMWAVVDPDKPGTFKSVWTQADLAHVMGSTVPLYTHAETPEVTQLKQELIDAQLALARGREDAKQLHARIQELETAPPYLHPAVREQRERADTLNSVLTEVAAEFDTVGKGWPALQAAIAALKLRVTRAEDVDAAWRAVTAHKTPSALTISLTGPGRNVAGYSECAICSMKPGSPTLCGACRANRAIMEGVRER